MRYIIVDADLIHHRKFRRFKCNLGATKDQALSVLVHLWSSVLIFAEDGDITKWSIDDVAEYAGWENDPQVLWNALIAKDSCFIDVRHQRKKVQKIIHNWWNYAGKYLRAKYHTYNPKRLLEIESMYRSTLGEPKGEPKGVPKGDLKGSLKEPQDKIREDKIIKDNNTIYVDFEKSTLTAWNSFCLKYPLLSAVKEISEKRRRALKMRFQHNSFNMNDILLAIAEQPFCLGENDRKWVISFDWLIMNDTNYLKVLERKYKGNQLSQGIKKWMKTEK